MQEKKDTIGHFFQRCQALEDKKGLSTVELCALIGLSRSHYYALKKGEKPLSTKVWRKLEAAERSVQSHEATREVIDLKQQSSDQLTRELVARLDRLTGLVEQLLEQRAATTRRAAATSSSSPGDTSQRKMRKTIPKKLA